NRTAAHATSTCEYFVDGELFATFDQHGEQPASNISHTLTGLPSGDHTILARWNVADTANAFYNCMDVTVGSGGGDNGGGDNGGDDGGDNGGGDNGGDTCSAAWDSEAVYTSGDTVTHDGH